MALKKTAAIPAAHCVACGRCVRECPLGAISVYKGLYAQVDERCIGCGKCVKICPAGMITLQPVKERQAAV